METKHNLFLRSGGEYFDRCQSYLIKMFEIQNRISEALKKQVAYHGGHIFINKCTGMPKGSFVIDGDFLMERAGSAIEHTVRRFEISNEKPNLIFELSAPISEKYKYECFITKHNAYIGFWGDYVAFRLPHDCFPISEARYRLVKSLAQKSDAYKFI